MRLMASEPGGLARPRRCKARHRHRTATFSEPPRVLERVPCGATTRAPSKPPGAAVSTAAPAKFFVNQGVVSSRSDMQNLLRPTLKQTVSYRFMRGRDLIAHGTGWVER